MNVIFSCRCCCCCFICYFCFLSPPPSLSLCFCCCGIVYVITSLRGVTKSFGIFIHFVFLVPLLVLMVSLPAADSVNLSPKVYLKLMPGAKTKQETLISQEIDFNLAVKNAKLFICIDWLPEPKKRTRESEEHNGNQIRALLGSDKGNTNVNGRAVGFEWISCNKFAHKEVFIQSEENLNNTLFYYSIVPLAIMYFKLIFDIIKFNFIQFHCCYLFVFMNSFNLIWFLNLFTAFFFVKNVQFEQLLGKSRE